MGKEFGAVINVPGDTNPSDAIAYFWCSNLPKDGVLRLHYARSLLRRFRQHLIQYSIPLLRCSWIRMMP